MAFWIERLSPSHPQLRYLQHEVETRIGRSIIAGDVAEGATVTVDVDPDGRWSVETSA